MVAKNTPWPTCYMVLVSSYKALVSQDWEERKWFT